MPAQEEDPPPQPATVEVADDRRDYEKLLCSYLGISFAVFVGLIPKSSISLVSTLQSRNRVLFLKVVEAEEQLRQLHSRRKEDSKANARVVEIFAGQRHAWQQDEKRLLQQIAAGAEEIVHLRARVEELEKTGAELRQSVEELRREVGERDEMLNFMTRNPPEFEDSSGAGAGAGGGGVSGVSGFVGDYRSEAPRFGKIRVPECLDPVAEESFWEREGQNVEEIGALYGQNNGFSPELLNSASKFWAEKANLWQV